MTFVARGGPELMVATHNQRSVENALAQMQVLGIKPKNPGMPVSKLKIEQKFL